MSRDKTTYVVLERPGILRCGSYEHGVVYEIEDPQEAQRLVEVKGFTRLAPAEAKRRMDGAAKAQDEGKTKDNTAQDESGGGAPGTDAGDGEGRGENQGEAHGKSEEA